MALDKSSREADLLAPDMQDSILSSALTESGLNGYQLTGFSSSQFLSSARTRPDGEFEIVQHSTDHKQTENFGHA